MGSCEHSSKYFAVHGKSLKTDGIADARETKYLIIASFPFLGRKDIFSVARAPENRSPDITGSKML